MSSPTQYHPGGGSASLDPPLLDDSESTPSLMARAAQNQSLLQDAEQRKLGFVQDALLDNQQVQQHRLALAQLAGEQNVNAARAAADVAVTDSTYQAAHDDAAWREQNAADLASARAELPGVLDAINTETDPLRLRDAAIAFHGRYAHLAQDPVLGPQYAALDGRIAARLKARDDEFRARISTAAASLRPYLDPAAPENLAAIRAAPLYRFARLDPTFARQIDDATTQAALAPATPAVGLAQAGLPLPHGGDFAVTLAALNPSTSAQASAAPPGSNTGGGFTITVPGLKPPTPTPTQPSSAPPSTNTNARGDFTVTVPGVSPSTPTPSQPSPSTTPPKATLTLSEPGLDFLQKREGYKSKIYLDTAKQPTIGYGHKLLPGEAEKYKNGITPEQARELLRKDVAKAEAAVRRNVAVDLDQEQFDALTSFTYNAGSGALEKSTLLKKINNGDNAAVPSEMARWNKIKNEKGEYVTDPGLSDRRRREGMLWHGVYDADSRGITPPGKR